MASENIMRDMRFKLPMGYARRWLLLWLPALAAAQHAHGAEIALRPQATCSKAIVRLADLADVRPAGGETLTELAELELLPAPAAGQEKCFTQHELRDLLGLLGVDVSRHTFTGAAQVSLTAAADRFTKVRRASASSASYAASRRQVEAQVTKAVREHLAEAAPNEIFGEIQPQLADEAVRQFAAMQTGVASATGGQAPWTGTQQFLVRWQHASRVVEQTVTVDVSPAPRVLALRRPLTRGAVLGAADVELVVQHATARTDDAFIDLDEVLGKELLQGAVAGQVLRRNMLRAPLLVKQGQPITVYSRAPGIQIRTVGIAKDDGSQGELVTVESPDTKQRYFARVTGMQEAEVMAAATSVAAAAAPSGPLPLPVPASVAQGGTGR